MRALDLFSAAAGGWTLGLHRAGFVTVAACEIVEWRRILYAENNPHVLLYADVRALTAARLVSDLGFLPDIIVGSPPCQDISVANTKGLGIDGERSGLYLEAVRLVGDCRPRWFAFENSAHLRTRGADRLLDALEALGYACEPCVVGAGDLGANHVRRRSWLIGFDPEQIADARFAISARRDAARRRIGRVQGDEGVGALRPVPQSADGDSPGIGRGSRRTRGRAQPTPGPSESPRWPYADADEARPADGRLEPGLRPQEVAVDGRGDERRDEVFDANRDRQSDGTVDAEMGARAGAGGDTPEPWADWNGGIADHLRLDDGISAWVAGTRVALGDGKRTSAASLIVEAFGDAVLPQIPEAIGRAILRTERALGAVLGLHPASLTDDGDGQ